MTSSNKMRLQRYIAMSGYASRRKAEELIANGDVFVNGEAVIQQGTLVSDADQIEIRGQRLAPLEEKVYYLINKPKGVVSTVSDTHNRPTVVDLIPESKRIFPVGRLDKETTGALILTNDGTFTQYLTHPKFDFPKTYRVSIRGKLSSDVVTKLSKGVTIDGIQYQGVDISNLKYDDVKERSQFSIVLYEGKNRQIRKMMDAFHLPVLKLHRYAIGNLEMHDLKIGEYRRLKGFEVKELLKVAKEG